MNIGDRKKMNLNDMPLNDIGVSVKKAMELISGSQFYEEIYDSLKLSELENGFISIAGC